MLSQRENLLRAWRFQRPERIPISVGIPPETWRRYGRELERIVLRHRVLFPGFKEGDIDFDSLPMDPRNRAGKPFTDVWGCVYEPREDDMPSYVSEHPLADWAALASYVPPDPEEMNGNGPIDWGRVASNVAEAQARGDLTGGSLIHGHLFLLLENLRGYQNLIMDMVDERPELPLLIEMIERFSLHIVRRYVGYGVDVMRYPEDLGAQDRPMISPALFRRYISPSYTRLMAPARAAGILVHMHSDGYLWDLMDDILECGVDVINPQDLVNGIDELAKNLKGRVAIELDVDRQRITPFGSPGDIDDLVRESVMKLGDAQGGLSLRHGLYSGAPLENIDALMTAMEKYSVM